MTITESGPPATAAGYSGLGVNVAITAPVATAGAPLVLQFVYDVTLYPAALNVNTIAIKRNGVTVPNCTGAGATPNPCVDSRTRLLPSNDVQIRVRTSQASDWGASVPLCGVFVDDPKPRLIVTDDKLKEQNRRIVPEDGGTRGVSRDRAPWRGRRESAGMGTSGCALTRLDAHTPRCDGADR